MRLTVLMPALNEEMSIGSTIDHIPFEKLRKMGIETDVLIIDGGSTDRTVDIAIIKGAKVMNSIKGYGIQYRAGFEKAQGDIIVTADSDCSYPMEDIPDLVDALIKENLDFITANRFGKLEKNSMSWLNLIGNRALTWVTNILFLLNLKDSQSGMWVIKKDSLKKITLKSNGMPLSQEIKIEAFKKLNAKEIESRYGKRVGQRKLRIFGDGWDNLTSLIRKRITG